MKKKEAVATTQQTLSTEMEGDQRPKRALRPAQCRTYLRRELSNEFEAILKGFVEQAKTGSCQHLKLTTELLEIEPGKKGNKEPRRKRGPGPVTALLLKMQKAEADGDNGKSDEVSRA
jgi:hypothetical protein